MDLGLQAELEGGFLGGVSGLCVWGGGVSGMRGVGRGALGRLLLILLPPLFSLGYVPFFVAMLPWIVSFPLTRVDGFRCAFLGVHLLGIVLKIQFLPDFIQFCPVLSWIQFYFGSDFYLILA